MKVVITGGGGYLGTLVLRKLLRLRRLANRHNRIEAIDRIILFDRSFASTKPPHDGGEIGVEQITGDVSDAAQVARAISGDSVSVFHLAALLTGVTERDLDSALAVNVDGTRKVLNALGQCGSGSKLVMPSSITIYRRDAGQDVVDDETLVRPLTIYGLTKAMSEQLGEAFWLAGLVDARAARLPTVVIRPKKVGTSAGASISDVLRDVSLGRPCDILLSLHTSVSVIDYASCVDGLVRLHDLDRATLGGSGSVNFPGITASIEQMIEAARAAARQRGNTPGSTRMAPDEFAQRTVEGWPVAMDATRAERLGITCTKSLTEICTSFIDDYESFWAHQLG
jgi:nucleoside-diphosphate-sugar epimerase